MTRRSSQDTRKPLLPLGMGALHIAEIGDTGSCCVISIKPLDIDGGARAEKQETLG
jgi:hypothetical protein